MAVKLGKRWPLESDKITIGLSCGYTRDPNRFWDEDD